MSDYLWDKTGAPDPEVERLEKLLGPFRHHAPLRAPRRPLLRYGAIAAGLLLAAAAVTLYPRTPKVSWQVASLQGAPRVASSSIEKEGRLAVGQWLETDAASKARLDVSDIGEITVDTNTQLRLVRSREKEHRVALKRGKIHAFIWAPPRMFFVDTPSAVAVDLGCKYTLQVDAAGTGLLEVEMGWVAFESGGRESFIPAGAACSTDRRTGPGIPYFLDAPDSLRAALREYERSPEEAHLRGVLAAARPNDAVTLWHLLARAPAREAVYEKLAALVPPPPGVTREGILRLDRDMMDRWWNQLGHDDASWWRKWKAEWRQ